MNYFMESRSPVSALVCEANLEVNDSAKKEL